MEVPFTLQIYGRTKPVRLFLLNKPSVLTSKGSSDIQKENELFTLSEISSNIYSTQERLFKYTYLHVLKSSSSELLHSDSSGLQLILG